MRISRVATSIPTRSICPMRRRWRVPHRMDHERRGRALDSSSQARHLIAQNCCNFFYPVRNVLPGVSVLNFHSPRRRGVAETSIRGRRCLTTRQFSAARTRSMRGKPGSSCSPAVACSTISTIHSVWDMKMERIASRTVQAAEAAARLRILSDFLKDLPLVEMLPDTKTVKHADSIIAHIVVRKQVRPVSLGDGPTDSRTACGMRSSGSTS